jgi:hypothetical protein
MMMLILSCLHLIKQRCLLVIFQKLKLITTLAKLINTFYINHLGIYLNPFYSSMLMHLETMMRIIYMWDDLFLLIILAVISNIICCLSVSVNRCLVSMFVYFSNWLKFLTLVFPLVLPPGPLDQFFFLVESFPIRI